MSDLRSTLPSSFLDVVKQLSREVTCPICLTFLEDPHLLPCGHHFCFDCIIECLKFQSNCPVCKGPSFRRALTKNVSMNNVRDLVVELNKHVDPCSVLSQASQPTLSQRSSSTTTAVTGLTSSSALASSHVPSTSPNTSKTFKSMSTGAPRTLQSPSTTSTSTSSTTTTTTTSSSSSLSSLFSPRSSRTTEHTCDEDSDDDAEVGDSEDESGYDEETGGLRVHRKCDHTRSPFSPTRHSPRKRYCPSPSTSSSSSSSSTSTSTSSPLATSTSSRRRTPVKTNFSGTNNGSTSHSSTSDGGGGSGGNGKRKGDKSPTTSTAASAAHARSLMSKRKSAVASVVLLGTALCPEQQKVLHDAARVLGGSVVKTFSSRVTHVITRTTSQGCAPRTIKYMMGVVSGRWVVKQEWLQQSIDTGYWIEESAYEVDGDTFGTGGPSASRLASSALFKGHSIYFVSDSFEAPDPSKADLQKLVRLGGGSILHSTAETQKKLSAEKENKSKRNVPGGSGGGGGARKKKKSAVSVLVCSQMENSSVVRECKKVFGRLPVSTMWIMDSISHHEVSPPSDYLMSV